MKISIVTPSFNQGVFIRDAITSVRGQGIEIVEHIIVDNCSTDETLRVLADFPDLRVLSEPDKGQSDALNKGFAMATGDIIGWLNADDLYTPGTFAKILEVLADDEVDAVYGNCIFVDQNRKVLRNLISHRPVRWLSLFHCFIPSTTFFFKRRILDDGVRIDNDLHITMDKEFFSHILYKGYKMQYINMLMAEFRWHDSNKSIDTPEVKKIRYHEGLKILNLYSSLNIPENEFSRSLYGVVSNVLRVYRRYLILTRNR